MARIRLPWGRKARERRQDEAWRQQQAEARAAFARITQLAETPTAPLFAGSRVGGAGQA